MDVGFFAQVPSTSANPLVLVAAAATWAGIWINVALYFYFKGEKLHQDYYSSGKIDAARSAIEAERLVPALAKMFDRALETLPNRRKIPKMIELLQAVEFLPDFTAAQDAMGTIEELEWNYRMLIAKAGRIWKWQFAHAFATVGLVNVFVFCYPTYFWGLWLLEFAVLVWLVTLTLSVVGFARFHGLLTSFTNSLETHGVVGR